jgi:hypothetical protein
MNQWLKNFLVLLAIVSLAYYGTYCGESAKNNDPANIEINDVDMYVDTSLTISMFKFI